MKVTFNVAGATDMQMYRLNLHAEEIAEFIRQKAGPPPAKTAVITLTRGRDGVYR